MTTTDARQRLAAIRAARAEMALHLKITQTALLLHADPDADLDVTPAILTRAAILGQHYGPEELRERATRLQRQHVATAGELRAAVEAFTAATARP